jgi:rhodanese-related sulfurtransferase
MTDAGYQMFAPAHLIAALQWGGGDIAVVDLQPSSAVSILDPESTSSYRQGHVPGASFAIRSRLLDTVDQIPGSGLIVFTSEDGVIARLAAAEVSKLTARPVAVLDGGTRAWAQAGLPLETSTERFLHEPDQGRHRAVENLRRDLRRSRRIGSRRRGSESGSRSR